MESTATLILAFFIIAAKFVVVGCKKLRMPPVIGLIMLGLTAGHAGLDLAKTHDTILQIESFSEIGVIILLFLVGLETDIGQLKSMGKHSLFIACAGVIIPFVAGFGLAYSFTGQVDRSLLMGSILTATSVSVSVLTFSDLGRLAFVEAKMVITSAIIDDIIAIILLSVLLGLVGIGNRSFGLTVLNISGYFVAAFVIGIFIVPHFIQLAANGKIPNIVTAVSLGLVLIYAWTAHHAGLASITGAYLCGVFIGRTRYRETVMHDSEVIGNTFFIPIFFIAIGMHIDISSVTFSYSFLLFFTLFTLVGIVTKVFGCGLVAKMSGLNWSRSLIIGAGMVPRGEVALVIVSLASANGKNLLTALDKASVIILILSSTILTPLLIRWGFYFADKDKQDGNQVCNNA
ncbi:MAG: cation:proton antiporter [Bacteriovoracaceae bacterium]|nr:cation:proton antiporter [Bacteriovoracaceae bacterium]